MRDHVTALDDVGGARTIGPLVRSEVLLQVDVRRWTESAVVAEDRAVVMLTMVARGVELAICAGIASLPLYSD